MPIATSATTGAGGLRQGATGGGGGGGAERSPKRRGTPPNHPGSPPVENVRARGDGSNSFPSTYWTPSKQGDGVKMRGADQVMADGSLSPNQDLLTLARASGSGSGSGARLQVAGSPEGTTAMVFTPSPQLSADASLGPLRWSADDEKAARDTIIGSAENRSAEKEGGGAAAAPSKVPSFAEVAMPNSEFGVLDLLTTMPKVRPRVSTRLHPFIFVY